MPGLDEFGQQFFSHVLGRAGDVLGDLTNVLGGNGFGRNFLGGPALGGRTGMEQLTARLPGVGPTAAYTLSAPRTVAKLPGTGAPPPQAPQPPASGASGEDLSNTFTEGAPTGGQFSPYDQTFAKYAGAQASDPQLMAIIAAGAKAESGFNPRAVGDNGHSVGLFQMHDAGAGAGLGAARYDPEVQARIMVPRYVAAYNKYKAMGYTGPQLAAWVAAEAEHPLGWDNPNSAAHAGYRSAYAAVTRGQ